MSYGRNPLPYETSRVQNQLRSAGTSMDGNGVTVEPLKQMVAAYHPASAGLLRAKPTGTNLVVDQVATDA